MLLLLLALPSIAVIAGPKAGLILGDESYAFGEFRLLISPLAVLSVIAVFRLAFGHRDWLVLIASAAWLGVGTAFAIETQRYSLLALTGVITLLLASSLWVERRQAERERNSTEA